MRQTPVWPVMSRSSGASASWRPSFAEWRKTGAAMRSYSRERPIGHTIVQEIFHWLGF